MLREINLTSAVSMLNETTSTSVILLHPNYEDRSIAYFESVNPNITKRDRIVSVIIELVGQRHVDILDERTRTNREKAIKSLKERGVPYERCQIEYPLDDPGSFRNRLRSILQQVTPPVNLFLDISSMPRELILGILDSSISISGERHIFKNVIAAYVWAEKYPNVASPQAIGSPRGYLDRRMDIKTSLKADANIILVIFPGSEGFEGRQVYDLFADFHCQKYVLFIINHDDPGRSLPTLRANQSLLQMGSERDDTFIEYYFAIPDGMRHLNNILHKAVEKYDGLFIAPFGPKPLTIGAFLALRRFQKKENAVGDIILLSTFQYTSTYSIGSAGMSIFEIDMNDKKRIIGE